MDRMHNRIGGSRRRRNTLPCFGYNLITIAQHSLESKGLLRSFEVLDVTVHVQSWMRTQHLLGLREDIFQKRSGNNPQRHFPINAAEREVINLIAEGRNVGALARIKVHHQDVLAIEIDVRRQIEREWSVSSFVFAQLRCIDPNRRSGHRSFEVDKHMLPTRFRRKLETTTIAGYKFIRFLVETMPRNSNISVRNDHALVTGVIEIASVRRFGYVPVVAPVPVDWNDHASGGGSRVRRIAAKCRLGESSGGDQRPGRLNELASIHLCLEKIVERMTVWNPELCSKGCIL